MARYLNEPRGPSGLTSISYKLNQRSNFQYLSSNIFKTFKLLCTNLYTSSGKRCSQVLKSTKMFLSHITCFYFITGMQHERHGISNHKQLDCWSNCLIRLTLEVTSKIDYDIIGPLSGNSPLTSGFPSQMVSDNIAIISIPYCHHIDDIFSLGNTYLTLKCKTWSRHQGPRC